MKKLFFLLFLVVGIFHFVSGQEKRMVHEYDEMIRKYYKIELNDAIRYRIFRNPSNKYMVWYYPSDTEIVNLWNGSKNLNPWIKDPRNIKPGTIIIWRTEDIPLYGRNMFTILKKGENPFTQARKILKAPFDYE